MNTTRDDVPGTPLTTPTAATPTAAPSIPAPRTSPDTAIGSTAPRTRTPARTPPRRRVTPGWTEIAVAAVVYVGLQIGLHALVVAVGLDTGPWLAAVSAVSALGAIAAALAVRVRRVDALFLQPARWVTLLGGVVLGLGTWLAARGGIEVWLAFGGTLEPAQPALYRFEGAAALVAMTLLCVLVVPVLEELLFRGVVVSALSRYGLVASAAGSAVLFGLAHGLAVVAVAAVVLGAANTVVVRRTGSIWPAVASHATFNAMSFGLTMLLS